MLPFQSIPLKTNKACRRGSKVGTNQAIGKNKQINHHDVLAHVHTGLEFAPHKRH
jgi:hypothetical protein